MRLPVTVARLAAVGLTCAAAVLPSAARAYYYVQPGVVVAGPPVVVVQPPVVVPAPVYVAPYPRAFWVPPHYNRFGRFIPGHWA